MRTIILTAAATLSLCTLNCRAEETLATYDWDKLASAHAVSTGVVVQVEGRAALKLTNTHDGPLTLRFLEITNPAVTKRYYALVGEVKYEQVHGYGCLEMWSHFPPEKPGGESRAYFSRTLGAGEMRSLTGDSNWRRFTVPFDRSTVTQAPNRLLLNLVFAGSGTVYLGPLTLVQSDRSLIGALTPPGVWWSDRTAGLIGGIGGGTLGCLASLLALLASRGRARGLVLPACWLMIALGVVSASLGAAAVALGQPYGVWFPCLLLGGLLLLIIPLRLREFRRHYEGLELRRIASLDTAQG